MTKAQSSAPHVSANSVPHATTPKLLTRSKACYVGGFVPSSSLISVFRDISMQAFWEYRWDILILWFGLFFTSIATSLVEPGPDPSFLHHRSLYPPKLQHHLELCPLSLGKGSLRSHRAHPSASCFDFASGLSLGHVREHSSFLNFPGFSELWANLLSTWEKPFLQQLVVRISSQSQEQR